MPATRVICVPDADYRGSDTLTYTVQYREGVKRTVHAEVMVE